MIALATSVGGSSYSGSSTVGTGYVRRAQPIEGITEQPQPTSLQPIALVEPTRDYVRPLAQLMTTPDPTPQPTQQPTQQTQPVVVPTSGGGGVQVTTSTVPYAGSMFDWRSVPVWAWALLALVALSMFSRKR